MRHIRLIFLASFCFSIHLALLAYINSSMLGQFSSPALVSISYAIASVLSIILVTVAPNIIRRIGNLRYVISTLCLSSLLLYLISTHKGISIVPFFILYFSLNSLVLYGLDLFLEHYSADTQTGNIRGIYLTISNIGWVIAPLLSAKLQNNFGFSAIYLVASIAVLFTMIIIFVGQRGFIDKAYTKSSLIDGLRVLKENKNIRILTILNFILQSFFVVMVIYSPVYLTSIIGFSWQNLGILLSIMLSAFVIFPYPAGRLADTRIGEKWLICISLFIMSTATFIFAKLGAASLFSYALVLFLTRMGASVLETMCDSAFFKQVSDSDSAVISVYRNMMPFAYTIGPLLAGAIFAISSYQTLFTILGMLVLVSIIIAMKLRIVKN